MTTRFELNEVEKQNLEKWVNSRKVKAALKKGAKLSITFSFSSGIGRYVEAELDKGQPYADMVVYPPLIKNITDLGSW